MAVALELADGSRWSEKRWELVDGDEVLGSLEQAAWWRRTWHAAAGRSAWDISRAGVFRRGLVARDGSGREHARYAPGDGVLRRRDHPSLTVRREGLLRGERALLDGARELVRLRPRTWRRGIEVEPAGGGRLDDELTLAVLLVCAGLIADRQDAGAAGATTAAAAGAAGS
jgi:hypothetical protein